MQDYISVLRVNARWLAGLTLCFITIAIVFGCATPQPRNIENVCDMFRENKSWYWSALDSQKDWGIPIPTLMAITYQESKFLAKARPPRRKLLGFIPWTRPSSSYGYSQAKDGTWKEYQNKTGKIGADRDDFHDAIDFIGWYSARTVKINGVARDDAKNLYFAYHEGNTGFKKKTYNKKPWLIKVANNVQLRSHLYKKQLLTCQHEFKKRRWWLLWLA